MASLRMRAQPKRRNLVISLSGFSRLLSSLDFRYASGRFPQRLRFFRWRLSHHGDALPKRLKNVNDRRARLLG
jgi:hypothetical protein